MNPLKDLITDEVYQKLNSLKFFDAVSLRNYEMRQKYLSIKKENDKISLPDAVQIVANEYPYLAYETVYSIIFKQQKYTKAKKYYKRN